MMLKTSRWRKLPVTLAELSIDTILRCGQSFRWRKIEDEWTCALHGRLFSLKQEPSYLSYKVTWPDQKDGLLTPANSDDSSTVDEDDSEALLRHYFSLDVDLGSLYEQWGRADANFRRKAPQFTGVRMLSQDAWEALIAFICSSNNNIARISQMVHKLCRHYGPLISYVNGEAVHDFPQPSALTGNQVESHLRELGFGYRAKYIAQTAAMVSDVYPRTWLESLRNPKRQSFSGEKVPKDQHATYKEAHEKLLTLSGVGPKVADCVCLMGLGWGQSVPVDTHVWQIAQRDYRFGKSKVKTLNKAMYDAVGDHFRDLWGEYAGWAHSVLFTADLREFASQTSPKKAKRTTTDIKEEETSDEDKGDVERKKKAIASLTEVKIEVKEEEDASEGVVVELKRRSKRLRTLK